MYKLLSSTLIPALTASCSTKTSSDKLTPEDIPSFPYEEILASVDSTESFPVIGDDGNGFSPIVNHIEYLEDEHQGVNHMYADSLQEAYNFTLAFNALAYDTGTYMRYIDDDVLNKDEFANAMDSRKMPAISDSHLRENLNNLRSQVAKQMRLGKPIEEDATLIADMYARNNEIWGGILSGRPENPEPFNPESILPDYAKIHDIAMTDTVNGRDRLLAMTLNESDFQKKSILAREFAYANFNSIDRDAKLLVAVIDPLLKSGQYSPILDELWLMWRAALQLYVFSSMSNDSAMYNLFYNKMRNRVANTLLGYIQTHRDDDVALTSFINLLYQYNICRNSECMFGNNANLDEMNLYYECWNKKIDKVNETSE